jgi:CubicO group peptidase (beta-lactamase class C family)
LTAALCGLLAAGLPGSAWRYSGGGDTVSQLLLGDVAKQPFPALMQTRVHAAARATSPTEAGTKVFARC